MKDPRNEKIERLERQLLKANRIRREELQQIVSAPQFFDAIDARIKTEERRQKQKKADGRRALPVWSWQRIGIVFGATAFLLTGIMSLILFAKTDSTTAGLDEQVAPLEIRRPVAAPAVMKLSDPDDLAGGSVVPPVKKRSLSERVGFRNKTSKQARAAAGETRFAKRMPRPAEEKEEAFYPLAFAGNLEEAEEEGQIIRVEMSRASLLALGLNPPMENETVKIKTDLLIGSDGVARGFRFVK